MSIAASNTLSDVSAYVLNVAQWRDIAGLMQVITFFLIHNNLDSYSLDQCVDL